MLKVLVLSDPFRWIAPGCGLVKSNVKVSLIVLIHKVISCFEKAYGYYDIHLFLIANTCPFDKAFPSKKNNYKLLLIDFSACCSLKFTVCIASSAQSNDTFVEPNTTNFQFTLLGLTLNQDF